MEAKVKARWKVIAIVFIVLFILENLFIGYEMYVYKKQRERTMECYYEICNNYPDADYRPTDGLCVCYDYSLLGELDVAKTQIIK